MIEKTLDTLITTNPTKSHLRCSTSGTCHAKN